MRNIGDIKLITGAELAIMLADDTQLTIDSEHIAMNGIVLDDSTSVDGQFTIGAAVTGQLTITILNEDNLYSPYNFRDATCQLTFFGVEELPDDEDEEVQEDSVIIGQYNIVDYTYDGSDITLTAYDNLRKFDIPCTETGGETVSFPKTLTALVQTAARICGVTLVSQANPIPNGSYLVSKQPDQWDSMTWHDVISYCAQLGGVYAKTDKYGRVYFDWYNINAIPQGYDGGTFDTTDTPYSDGDDLDGGNFSYNNTEDSADGGTFNYPVDMHFIQAPYALTVDTDDVYITGLKVVLTSSDNINANENTTDYTTPLYGTDGYVITISGNLFIQTTAQADAIKDFLGPIVVGMWFRPLNATIDDDLSIEAGDQAYINGTDGNTYQCFISHATFTTNSATIISCDAEPISSSKKTRFTAADKMANHIAQIQRRVDSVAGIAGNTNQYFWHREIGIDTGAHITEVPQEEWSNPDGQDYHSGANILIRSNGIAVRDGLNELAQFRGDGTSFYDPYGIKVFDEAISENDIGTTYSEIYYSETLPPETSYSVTMENPYFLPIGEGEISIDLEIAETDESVPDRKSGTTGYFQLADDLTTTLCDGLLLLEYDASAKSITVSCTDQNYAFYAVTMTVEWYVRVYPASLSFGTRYGSRGAYSSTFGEGLKAERRHQVAIGRFNENTYRNLFEIGAGEGDTNRKTVFSVDDDGNVRAVGDILQTNRNIDYTFFSANSPFQVLYCHARRFGGLIHFSMEIYITGTFIANYRYTVGTIASDYVPHDIEVGTGHSTDSSYNPVGLATWIVNTNGDLQISLQSTAGGYVFLQGFYPY